MLGLPILDVAIGIAFFYLTFAMVCTTVNETLSRWFNMRPKTLEEALQQLLGSDTLKNKILNNPLILGLSRKNGKAKVPNDPNAPTAEVPSYIPASTFTTALLDHLTGDSSIRDTAALKAGIDQLPETPRKALTALYEKVNGDWEKFHQEVECLYKDAMDRASGWYKRYIQKQTKVLAILIVLWVNFDSLNVADRLWNDSALRAAVVEDAKARSQARTSGDLPLAVYNQDEPDKGTAVEPGGNPIPATQQSLINSVMGWQRDLDDVMEQAKQRATNNPTEQYPRFWVWLEWALMHILGWGISIFAISLGAPFWFDTLNRFMNLRNTGRAPDEPRAKNTSVQTQKTEANA